MPGTSRSSEFNEPREAEARLDTFIAEIRANLRPLQELARKWVGCRAAADDLVQETLLRAWRSRETYEPATEMYRWLFVIMRNCVANEKHREFMYERTKARAPKDDLQPVASAHDRIEAIDVCRAVLKLPQDQREILLLIATGGVEYDDAADLLNCSANTLKSRVRRARQKLSETFA